MVGGYKPEQAQILYDLGCAFATELDFDELLPSIIERCRDVLGAEGASVLLLDESTNELHFPYVAEEDEQVAARLASLRFPADQGIAGAVMTSGRSQIVSSATEDPRFYGQVDEATGFQTGSMLSVPLRSRRGAVGVMQVVRASGAAAFGDEDLGFLEALAGSVAIAIDNARLYGELKASEERLRSEVVALRRDLARHDRFTEMVGSSEAMAEVIALMESAAASPISVLVQGETGTGKELVARGIHRTSERAEAAFIAVNCGALHGELLESELFGHARGAFTGATADRRGLFETADGGTIFLDEVGELPMAMQVKLLRVLQEGEITPVGTSDARRVDVRLISASNRNLLDAVSHGRFRQDLYYRVAAFPITVPPLRERREDIALLVGHLLGMAAERHKKSVAGIAPAAFELLLHYDWPGNVRQLENEIERGVALVPEGGTITAELLSEQLRGALGQADAELAEGPRRTTAVAYGAADTLAQPLRDARADFEARYIAECLRLHDGNVSRTAEALGLSRVMLQRKLKAYGLR